MSTIINATTTNGVVIQPDNSGSLVLQTNNGTTALTVDTSQNTTLAGKLTTASSGIQFSDASTQTAAASPYTLKNKIINGDMRIDQRNAGAAIASLAANTTYLCDRWAYYSNNAGKFKYQQNLNSITPPTGFNNYLGVQQLSAPTGGDVVVLQQSIEGYNFADLGFGTANAKTITISFWVYSSLTGTFGATFMNYAQTRTYPFTYTISSANTWTQISVTIAGDTGGTWVGASNAGAASLIFCLWASSGMLGTANSWTASNVYGATGQVLVGSTSSATFYITGVQLEQNTSATPFERRLYNQELANCQRYYQKIIDPPMRGVGTGGTSGGASRLCLFFANTMRAVPTLAINGTFTFWNGSTTATGTSLAGYWTGGLNGIDMDISTSVSFTIGQAVTQYLTGDQNKYVTLSSEL